MIGNPNAPAKLATLCTCKAYRFPHRPGGGACRAEQGRMVCYRCGQWADPVLVEDDDDGCEFWGARVPPRPMLRASDCCESTLMEPNVLRRYSARNTKEPRV